MQRAMSVTRTDTTLLLRFARSGMQGLACRPLECLGAKHRQLECTTDLLDPAGLQ